MNSLASTKRVVHLLMALAAIAGLFLTVGCGNSSKAPSNPQGFTNSSLTGTYVFSSTGVDASGVFLAIAGVFTVDGSGNVAGGNIDINGFEVGQSSTAINPATGAYSVGVDGRGQITLTTSGAALPGVVLDFVLSSTSHGLVTEFDGDGSGSGTLDLQATGTLTGSYSFGVSGAASFSSSTGVEVPLAMVGTFNSGAARSQGITFNGLSDINSGGAADAGLNLVAAVTAGSPGTATLSSYNSSNSLVATYNFHVYTVDATHLKLIETDAAPILAGDAFTQQTSIPSGVYAYTMEGLDASPSPGPFPMALAGFFTSDGSSVISTCLEDYNDDGAPGNVTGTGTCGSFTPFSGGRTQITLNSFYNGVSGVLSSPVFAAYPSSGGIELLEIDNGRAGALTGGFALPQGSSTTVAAQGYGLNISAVNTNGEQDDIAEFVVNSSNNYSGLEDINDDGTGTLTPRTAFDGTLTSNSAAPGYGSAASSTGEINFNYYVANNGATILILETDSNQLGLGAFEPQSSTAAVPASRVTAMVRPMVRPHAAAKRR